MAFSRLLAAFILLPALMASTGIAVPEVSASDPKPLRFNWAFVGHTAGDQDAKLVVIDGDMALKSGDKFKFFFEMAQQGYVYLIMLDSQSDIHLIYPNDLKHYASPPPPTGALFIPAGTNWFQLDDKIGLERFHLLVSKNRLDGLEALLARYATADSTQKPALSKDIEKKIRKLRWAHRQFKKSAERPDLMMGRTRGVDNTAMPDSTAISDLATAFEADTFYSRTFTIDHQ